MDILPVVNIYNRCNRVCRCKGGKYLTAKAGTVGNTDFRYCTHKAKPTVKISGATWKSIEIERVGYAHPFDLADSITTYFHSRFDGKQGFIKKPLLIRVRDSAGKTHWFENVGHYANKKWKRIDREAWYGSYPENDKYSSKNDFTDKLKKISCRLFVSHAVRINSDGNNQNDYQCPICNQPVNVTVKNDIPSKILGYTKYEFTGTLSDKSILAYKDNQITYRRQNKGFPGYYLPIQLEEYNVKSVNVYYWDGDIQRENPLLIEVELNNGISYWFENITNDVKHDKWKPIWKIGSHEYIDYISKIKEKLSVLNCIYNKTVQINIGEKKNCHESKHYLHKNRIRYGYSEAIGTDPVLYAYRYGPSLSSEETPFNISEVVVNGLPQSFKEKPLPSRSVTNFMTFVSPCDKDKPFLICVETGSSVKARSGKNYAWYYRKTNGNDWRVYPKFTCQSPENVIYGLKDLLESARATLGLRPCHMETSADGVQLDITKIPEQGKNFREYRDDSNPKKKVPIFVTKSKDTPLANFFKNSHRPATNKRFFVVQQHLVGGDKIGSSKKISAIETFNVYFWEGNTTRPIIIEVKRNGEPDTRYYGKGDSVGSSWLSGSNQGRSLLQSLDHWNCENNNAIPIELTEPTNLTSFYGKKGSTCLQNNFITLHGSLSLPKDAERIYEATSYNVNVGKRISRLTYDNNPTNIVPLYDYGITLNIYHWTKSSRVPLLVEFKPKDGGQSDWYENLSRESTKWKPVGKKEVDGFYDNKKGLTENLTKKLHEVNCRIHGVIQIDVSRTTKEPYCHSSGYVHEKMIMVTSEPKSAYPGFTGYEHTPVDPLKALTVSSFYNGNDKQEVTDIDFPLENVEKVIVYFPNCAGGYPVAMRIYQDGRNEKWLKREENDNWRKSTTEFENKDGVETKILLDGIKNSTNACTQPPLQTPRGPNPGGTSSSGQQFYTSNNDTQGVSEPFVDVPDEKFALDKIFDSFVNLDYEQNSFGDFVRLDDEHEDQRIVEEQNRVTFVSVSASIPSVTTFTTPGVGAITLLPTPNVIIDINMDIKGDNYTYTVKNSGEVCLQKGEYPDISDFYMFTHEASDDIPFKVDEVIFGSSGDIPDIIPKEKVASYSVWYWKHDNGMKNPLIIEIANSAGKYKYDSSKDNWKSWSGAQEKNKLEGEELEKELDDVNCRLNKVVTMDLSSGTRDNGSYCCGKVGVDFRSIQIGNSSILTYYVHSIKGTTNRLAKIKYYIANDPNRKRINSNELKFPISGVKSVSVFYCQDKPAPIYIDPQGGQPKSDFKGWYKRGNDDEAQWINVSTDLSNVTPNNVGNNCDSFNKITKILRTVGCKQLVDCYTSPSTVDYGGSTVVVPVVLPDSQVTIYLSKNKKVKSDGTTHYYQDSTGKKSISVKRSPYPTEQGYSANFYDYKHKLENGGEKFILLEVKSDDGSNIPVIGRTENVTSVSAYYWRHELDNALLVGITTKDGNTATYYRNSKDGKWQQYKLRASSGHPSQAELELLNCEINDVVQIDVSKIADYCHEPLDPKDYHTNKKVKVVKVDDHGHLGNYTAYEHTPNPSGTFNISAFNNGGTPTTLSGLSSGLPIRNTSKVTIFICRNSSEPLLIHMEALNISRKWFKRANSTGLIVSYELNATILSDSPKILNILDTLDSTCKPPLVTINIYNRPSAGQSTTYGGASYAIAIGHCDGSIPDFTEYSHTVYGRNYFTLKQVNYNDKPTTGIVSSPMSRVTKVSVYYWTSLETYSKDTSRPLLVKVTTKEPGEEAKETYYENEGLPNNTEWKEWRPNDPSYDLTKKLHLLNCKLNSVVIVDISQKNDYDACVKDNNLDPYHGERMQVTKNNTSGSENPLGSYEVYEHFLKTGTNGNKFHIVSFKNGNSDIILPLIGETTLTRHILDVGEIKVYRCDSDDKSLMVYINTDDPTVKHKWYKNTTGEIPGNWVHIDKLSSTAQHEEVKKALDTIDSRCKPPEGEHATAGTAPHDGEQSAQPKDPVPEATAESLTGPTVAATIGSWAIFGGSTSGTLAGAGGLTGLGWWAFKRSKGDPWVRQI
ncbi:hypothetical protein BEWA_003840 [Theileria equi strain WA]|uniref:Uncharacterized protein n=1 Tax=Theileria equi strain WA TaxID=1537102 RepID=L0B165_THEEQ|nr:hypothetical protein BEWA_003840 [Theileria equi strain WA]AFZ80976.1 hypothetical protein BEWA_003840 [Theileria equi strain WA]|eukprot:XP_004830642.1 hypothetical protein BEWA_003840 [Theileria equi strain WA]